MKSHHQPTLKKCDEYLSTISQLPHEVYWSDPGIAISSRLCSRCFKLVLDVGFQYGHSSVWLGLYLNIKTIVSIDVNINGAAIALKNVQKYIPDTKILMVCCTAESLPFKNNSFDLIFCRSGLQYIDMAKGIMEFRRSCRPTESIYLISNMSGNPLIKIYRWFKLSKSEEKGFQIKRHLSWQQLDSMYKGGEVTWYETFHLLTPLLYPILPVITRISLFTYLFRIVFNMEKNILKIIPAMKRFCWYSSIEIKS